MKNLEINLQDKFVDCFVVASPLPRNDGMAVNSALNLMKNLDFKLNSALNLMRNLIFGLNLNANLMQNSAFIPNLNFNLNSPKNTLNLKEIQWKI